MRQESTEAHIVTEVDSFPSEYGKNIKFICAKDLYSCNFVQQLLSILMMSK